MKRLVLPLAIGLVGVLSCVETASATQQALGEALQDASIAQVMSDSANDSGIAVDRSWQLIETGQRYAATGLREQAIGVLLEAEQAARSVTDPVTQDQLLVRIVAEQAKLGNADLAIAITSTMGYETYAPEYCCIPLRTEAERAIAQAYLGAGQVEQAVQFAQSIESADSKYQVLTGVINELASQERFDQAIALTNSIVDDTYQKVSAQHTVVRAYARANRYDEGLAFTNTIPQENNERSTAQYTLAQMAIRNGQYDQARQIAQQLTDVSSKIQAFTEIAFAYAGIGESQQAVELISQAYELAQANAQIQLYSQWVYNFAQVGAFDRALQVANSAENEYDQADSKISLARAYLNNGEYERAFEIAQTVQDGELQPFADIPDPKVEIFNQIVERSLAIEQDGFALRVARTYGGPVNQTRALRLIAQHYTKTNQPESTVAVLAEALEVAKTIDSIPVAIDRNTVYNTPNSSLLLDIATDYARLGETEQAIATVDLALQSVQTYNYATSGYYSSIAGLRTSALTAIAAAYADLEQDRQAVETLSAAVSTAATIENTALRVRELSQIAKTYGAAGQEDRVRETLTEALQLSESIADTQQKLGLWNAIAEAYAATEQQATRELINTALQTIQTLDESQQDGLIGQLAIAVASSTSPTLSLELVNRISDPIVKTTILVEIGAKYAATNPQPQAEVIAAIVQAADSIPDRNQRNNLLNDLIRNQYAPSWSGSSLWQYDFASQLNTMLQAPNLKAYNWALIAWGYANYGQSERASEVLERGLELADAIADPIEQEEMHWQMLNDAIGLRHYDLATQVANRLKQPAQQAAALRQISHLQ
ncbi:hypothetical protein H6G00_04660 [Leptolyngbya sp. FACHB-541]|uniref:tetratricopeptide repeat protein n=1 Tax=Leptolyngbya sp. FACHB-541 TaxID=2692810 RepID=UPI001682AE47|nr:hypothetical protein [Leptolyngbya sp. FACHB-541]MBD1995918.1 hypothetical protein [Leptolyngbya sp. FACHB-541]